MEDADARVARQTASTLVERYLEDDVLVAALPVVPTEELEASRVEVDRLAEVLRSLEVELEEFKWNNAAALPELYELNIEAMDRADRERAQLDAQVQELEARRIELDRGLRDMQRGGDAFRLGRATPLTSEGLVALQSQWAVLRGRYGNDDSRATQRGNEISQLQATAQARLDTATSGACGEAGRRTRSSWRRSWW